MALVFKNIITEIIESTIDKEYGNISAKKSVIGDIICRIMENQEILTRYNYDEFIPEKFGPWMRWEEAPRAGTIGPDFPLWMLDGKETSLHSALKESLFTIVEFGSFT